MKWVTLHINQQLQICRTVQYYNVIIISASFDVALGCNIKMTMYLWKLLCDEILSKENHSIGHKNIVNNYQRKTKTFTTTIIIRAKDNHNLELLFRPTIQSSSTNKNCHIFVITADVISTLWKQIAQVRKHADLQ